VSQSAAQAAAFFRDVAQHRTVWMVRDDIGSPAPVARGGKRAAPYWSTRARAQRAAKIWGQDLRAEPLDLTEWRESALPELALDDYVVGINWSGPRLVGYEFTVAEVENRLRHALGEPPYGPPH
jgi:hypothetical protein